MKILRDYQVRSQDILATDSSGLDASDLGTGKTLTGVERVREISGGLGRPPRILVVAPPNTQRQWRALFAEQFPSLRDDPHLRIVGTPLADPESWNDHLLKKKPGIYIIGWEAMRGSCPKEITIIKKETRDRIEGARARMREAKRILSLKRTGSEEKKDARAEIAACEELVRIQPGETAKAKGEPPTGWVPKDPGGASRGYGTLYKRSKLTKQAVLKAMRSGDIPPWQRTGQWDLVICDEAHRMCRRDSSNKLAMSVVSSTFKLAMSATPAGNRPEGLWSLLNWLWPKTYSSYTAWVDQHMEKEEVRAGDRVVSKIVGEKIPGAAWVDVPCKVRHRARDVRGELPDVIERVVEVDMTAEQRRVYDEFADQSLAWIDDHPVGEPLPLSQRIRLRQAALGTLTVTSDDPTIELGYSRTAEQPKLDMIKDIISDLPEDEPVIIYSHSRKWVDMAVPALVKATGSEVRAWTGSQNGRQRDEIKEAFGKDVRIIVAQIQAIAEGVDGLQHHCCCEIWASPTEDGIINRQTEGRLHRDGQTRPVQRWLLHSLDSIDIGLDESLRLRRAQMRRFYRDKEKR